MNMKKFFKAFATAASAVSLLSVSAITAFADDAASSSSQTNQGGGSMAPMLISLVLIFVLMYFLMIRPQKKKDKETKAMQSNIQIGDEIVTIGGIVGMVIRKGDDNVVIETGGEKNKMRIKLWAISENTSAIERSKAAQAEKKNQAALSAGKLKDDSDEDKKSKGKKKKDSEE